jgi:hypothetical protein
MPLKPAGPDSTTAAGRVLAAGGGLNGQFAWQGLAAGMAKVQREDALLKSAEQAFVATLGFLAGARLFFLKYLGVLLKYQHKNRATKEPHTSLDRGFLACLREDALLKSAEQASVATLGFLAGAWLLVV